MKRNAEDADRPIHPVLVGIPMVLMLATIVLELAHLETGNASFFHVAMVTNLAGVVMALVAVIPAATGVKHSIFNSLTVALFAISAVLLLRSYNTGEHYVHLPLAFGMLGLVAMAYAGTLGYALPSRLHASSSSRSLPAARNLRAAH